MTKLEDGQVLIHGKVYDTVALRVSKFRKSDDTANFAIETELIDRTESDVVIKAIIKNDEGRVIATGHAEENRTASTINKTSALEVAETSAIGRALAAFGLAGTEFASADEVAQAIHQQSAPRLSAQLMGMATVKQRDTIKRNLDGLGIASETQAGYLIETFGVEVPLTKEGASFVISEMFDTKGITAGLKAEAEEVTND